MKRRWLFMPVAAAAALIGVGLVLAGPAAAMKPGEAVALLDSAQSGADPQLAYSDQFDLVPDSIRFAGEASSGRFWVALGSDGKVCVIAVVGTPETGGAACAPAAVVDDSGVMMGLSPVREAGVEELLVYLVPDSVDLAGVRGPWQQVGTNVLVADASAARSENIVVLEKVDGSTLALTP